MTPSRLPPPSSILADRTEESALSSKRMDATSQLPSQQSLPADAHTQLPGFGELLDSLPEAQRDIDAVSTSSSSPATSHQEWNTVSSFPHRPVSGRGESRRASWHPYSPPYCARGLSRSQSPANSDHSDDAPQPRTARPTYTEEEIYFIWYHRDDLQLPWPQILELFNLRFGARLRAGVQGVQCRYYRALDIHGVPKARSRDRSLAPEAYGVRSYAPGKVWSWMSRDYSAPRELPATGEFAARL